MNLVRFEPWTIADLVQRDFDRLPGRRFRNQDSNTTLADWVPAVDIIEEKDRFLLRADVPGVDRADIDVSMDNGILSISGERRAEARSEAESTRRVERASGRFLRRFTLPDTADAESITAKCVNGILEIVIPKAAEVQARRISVDAA
jgi:HSP20 family protein